jgi:creatinine amidohydrolase
MFYVEMRPKQIREAVMRNVPIVMSAGAVEYHGPHLPIGTDWLIAETILRRVEQRCECIVMPPLPFSPTMFWAAGPSDGEFDFDPEALRLYAREILRGLVKIGFRRIYVLQHHQGDNGLPALTLRRAAAEVVRETTCSWSHEWGRLPGDRLPNPDIFSLIQVAYLDSFSPYPSLEAERCPVGHGGKGETQLIMSDYASCVEMDEVTEYEKEHGTLPEWLKDAKDASREEGESWVEFCVRGWVTELARV